MVGAVVIEVQLLSPFRTLMGLITLVSLVTISRQAVDDARRLDMEAFFPAALVMNVRLKSLSGQQASLACDDMCNAYQTDFCHAAAWTTTIMTAHGTWADVVELGLLATLIGRCIHSSVVGKIMGYERSAEGGRGHL